MRHGMTPHGLFRPDLAVIDESFVDFVELITPEPERPIS